MSNSFDDYMDACFKAHADAETKITSLVYEEDFLAQGFRVEVWMNNKPPRKVLDENGQPALFESKEEAKRCALSAFDQWETDS